MSRIIEMVLRELGVNDEDKIQEIRDTGITDKIYYDSVSPDSQSSAFGSDGLKYYDIMIKFYTKIKAILPQKHEREFFKRMGGALIQKKAEPASSLLKTPKKKGGGKRRRKSKRENLRASRAENLSASRVKNHVKDLKQEDEDKLFILYFFLNDYI